MSPYEFYKPTNHKQSCKGNQNEIVRVLTFTLSDEDACALSKYIIHKVVVPCKHPETEDSEKIKTNESTRTVERENRDTAPFRP